jgi:hypothetical protein
MNIVDWFFINWQRKEIMEAIRRNGLSPAERAIEDQERAEAAREARERDHIYHRRVLFFIVPVVAILFTWSWVANQSTHTSPTSATPSPLMAPEVQLEVRHPVNPEPEVRPTPTIADFAAQWARNHPQVRRAELLNAHPHHHSN